MLVYQMKDNTNQKVIGVWFACIFASPRSLNGTYGGMIQAYPHGDPDRTDMFSILN